MSGNTDPSEPDNVPGWQRSLERALWNSRYLVLVAIIPSLLGALTLLVIGTADIFSIVRDAIGYYSDAGPRELHKDLVKEIVLAVDIYLIAVVLIIFGLGLYRLFIAPIPQSEEQGRKHPFNVESFDQLKDKITRVVILAVIIEFFRAVTDITFAEPLDAIFLAASVLALAAALYLMSMARK